METDRRQLPAALNGTGAGQKPPRQAVGELFLPTLTRGRNLCLVVVDIKTDCTAKAFHSKRHAAEFKEKHSHKRELRYAVTFRRVRQVSHSLSSSLGD